nr:F-box protein At3g07870-like [Nicotiana tomentosiformis]
MSEYLPQEVLIEIFLKLPTKSIIQCTSVCKSWYSLITSPNFISTYLNYQDDYLLVRHCSGEPLKEFYALFCDNENFDQYAQFDFPFECETHFNIVGSCNGLLCLSDDLWGYRDRYYIWNPSIRKSVKLPEPIFRIIWYSLITSPNFISVHLNNQDDYLLVRHCSGKSVKENYALFYDNENFDQYAQFDFPFESYSHFNIVDSCNGLLCLSDDLSCYRDLYYIWNPSIRKSVKLPEPIFTFETHGPFDHTLGFGFDSVTNDYKVVRIVHTGDNVDRVPPHVELYKLSTGVWQDITPVSPSYKFFRQTPGVYVNGACHWVASQQKRFGRYMIVLFDMHEETFWEMMVPGCLNEKFFGFHGEGFVLFVSDESLCLAESSFGNDKTIDIWMMKEYGDPESWVKQFSISLRDVSFNISVVDEIFSLLNDGRQHQVAHFLVKPIASRENGEFLWRADNGLLVSYDPEAEKIKNLGIHNANYLTYRNALYVNTYKMSLILLGKRTDYFTGDTCKESNLCKREAKGGRKVRKGNTRRGLCILSPFKFGGLMYMSKMKVKRLRMIKRKNRFQADIGSLL